MATSQRTFAEASKEIQASLQRHLEKLPSDDLMEDFSDEEAADEDPVNSREDQEEILRRVFGSYELGGKNATDYARTREAIAGSFSKGHINCLICIGDVKRKDAIWSCEECRCIFHLQCIQRWSRDSIFQQRNELENENGYDGRRGGKRNNTEVVLKWGCPKCRCTYTEKQTPTRYTCFCAKVVEPQFDPWIVPHSCGDPCGKPLKPACGHTCLILCHPGPCPPCPKMVKVDCFCGQSAPATKRCFDKKWSCGKPCRRDLNCGHHKCPEACHEGQECPPCNKTSVQLCKCNRHQRQCDCAEPQWQCEDKCRKPLSCGYHMCEIVCHEGECPPCPLSQLRTCPCGKSHYKLPCTEATPTCGDTCGKTLACESHVCAERCHRGTCGSCLQMVVKQCKCGGKKKEVPCAKEYTCDTKCRRLRDCKKHTCNRKCCDGNCPQCDQQCNRTLACKNHKCNSRCHQGTCYPCTLTKEVSCNCGISRILVPCGMERTAKPPKCRMRCQTPPDCHHPSRQPHPCHFGPCPTCKQLCNVAMKCGHNCPVACHDQVLVKVEESKKAAGPWEVTGPKHEIKNLACPDCQYPVPVTCLGGHETSDWPCFTAKSSSCGRPCGRQLPCGNHTCTRVCHRVKHAPDDVMCGTNCRKCEAGCTKPRPQGCAHPCLRPCHPEDCEPCPQIVRIWCHCAMTQLYVKCGGWLEAGNLELVKREMGCCQDQCPKLMPCGHRCVLTCHPGPKCSESSVCKKKVKLWCPCKRRKQDTPCNRVAETTVQCDEECEALKDKARTEEEKAKQRQEEEAERLQREEALRFEMKMEGKRKRRNRRRISEAVQPSFVEKFKLPMLIFVSALLIAFLAFYFYPKTNQVNNDVNPPPPLEEPIQTDSV